MLDGSVQLTCCCRVRAVSCYVLRMAYVIYEDKTATSAAYDKLITEPPSVAGKQLRLMKYDPSVEWPSGNLLLLYLLLCMASWPCRKRSIAFPGQTLQSWPCRKRSIAFPGQTLQSWPCRKRSIAFPGQTLHRLAFSLR